MQSLSEQNIQCPYCGEEIFILVDPSEAGTSYIEDCQVCCRPIEFSLVEDLDGDISLSVSTDTD
ncbi:MAG: CPXCG motif-containing cysteine-rich protein [Pseudomonadales bacterium]